MCLTLSYLENNTSKNIFRFANWQIGRNIHKDGEKENCAPILSFSYSQASAGKILTRTRLCTPVFRQVRTQK